MRCPLVREVEIGGFSCMEVISTICCQEGLFGCLFSRCSPLIGKFGRGFSKNALDVGSPYQTSPFPCMPTLTESGTYSETVRFV